MSMSSKLILRGRGRATLIVLLLVVPLVFSLMAGAYVNHPLKSSAPGDGTCRDCHSSYGLNAGDGYIKLTGLPEKYECGKAYILTVTVYSPDKSQFCFVMTAEAEDDGYPAGTFSCIDSTETCIKGNGEYIETTKMGCMGGVNSMKTWQIQWNSPSMAESAITFYGCGLGGDGGGNKGGDCVYTCKMSIYPAPKVPVQPAGIIVEPGDGRIGLTWFMPEAPDPLAGSVSYNIYWSDTSTGPMTLLCTVSDCQYIHTGVQNGRTYRYQISGSNSEGEGALSAVARAKPGSVPERPLHLAAGQPAADCVPLSWDAPSEWGTGGGHSFTVYRGETPWSLVQIATGVTQNTYVDEGPLSANMTYHYRVQAVTDIGPGGVAILTVDVPSSPPSFPLGLSVMVRKGVVELTWQPPSDPGGDEVREYRVYRTEEGKEPILIKDHLTETTYNDPNGDFDATYEYTVAAVNSAGEGAFSTPVEAYIAPPPTTGEAGGVTFSGVPFSGLVIVGAVIIIGALIMARLNRAASVAERRDR